MRTRTRLQHWLSVLLMSAAFAHAEPGPPNIVLILADDLGWNDVGYHGSEIRTPNLDALAREGVALDHYYSQPTCTVTRTALLTGMNPQRLGIYRQFAKNATHGLPTSATTLAEHLGQAGYQNWLVGKWHLGHLRWQYHPTQRGFDHFYGHMTGGIGYWDHVHGGGLDWQRNGETLRETGYSTHLLRDEAISLIRQRDPHRPFFLYASFNAPHLPNEAPETALAAYAEIENPHRRTHAAMVSELDRAIGDMVEALASEGLLENTVIWFMSDNGGLNPSTMGPGILAAAQRIEDWLGAPAPITFLEFIRTNALEGGADNTPLRFGKGSLYEGGVRVPSLIHWPAGLESGPVNAMITAQDVLPTLLASAGIEPPEGLDGKSRLPVLRGESDDPPNDYVTVAQFGEQAYYRWPWKLITVEDGYELYNLADDPLETTDRAASEPERMTDLLQRLDALPRGENIHIATWRVMLDPDFFGGEEDRPPWADLVTDRGATSDAGER